MKYISVCSGIEAATVAWRPLGWEAEAFAEIEPFPSAVLAHHYPEIPNLGDITKVAWRKYAGAVGLIVGGTPCQSFSVAGKQEGLDGASGLVREYFRILEEVRPRWFVWENVPGCLFSKGGADFAFILGQWNELGYHVAWRVLDAQYFGVPQRRRRVFAVGHLGGWQYPAAVLFEPESLRGNTSPRRKAGKENPGSVTESIGNTVANSLLTKVRHNAGDETLIAKCLTSSNQRLDWETETLVLNDQGGKRMDISEGVAGTLRSQSKGHEPIVFEPGIMSRDGGYVYEGTAPTLRAEPGDNQPAIFCIAGNTIDRQIQNGGNGSGFQQEISYTLNTIDRHAVAQNTSFPCVRRLTPTECERLQGFPDGYTDIEFKGKPAPDGARYKALGNSMAVPCMRWIGKRIQTMEDIVWLKQETT